MSPLVSVIIPLYNKEKYISRAIDSVLTQTISDFEIIVVDDGSKDRGPEIVNQYSDSRIKLVHQENQGVSSARNCGVSKANAELIAFLDADDEWMSCFLETILNLKKLFPKAGLYGSAYAVYSDETFQRNNIWNEHAGERKFTEYFGDSVIAGFPLIITSSSAIPREVFLNFGGYRKNFRAGQDHDLFGRIALFHEIVYSPKVCVKYNAGMMNNADTVSYVLEVPLQKYLNDLPEDKMQVFNSSISLFTYLDFWRLKTGGRNIYSGFKKEGREQIRLITSKQFIVRKNMFLCISYLPIPLSWLSPKLIRKIANKIGLAT